MIGFILGCLVGGLVGVVAMCLFAVSSAESRREEQYEHREP